MSGRQALVLGGGVAGLRAAFALLDRGHDVELFDARRGLGGRAFTLPDKLLDEPCDNGPHVMLGCYTEMRALLRRIGTEHEFVQARRLELAYRDAAGSAARLRLPPGPTPLWFGLALAGVRGLGLGGWLRGLRGLAAVLRDPPATWSVEDWLRAHGQHGAPRHYLWDPMCRAIMNTEATSADARMLVRTLRRAFLGSGRAAGIWIPKQPWSALLGDPARARLVAEGARVTLGARVERIDVDAGRVAAVRFADGGVRAIDPDTIVVAALPWHVLARVLPPGALPAAALEGSPIVSVWFEVDGDARLPSDPLVALVDGAPFHFLTRRPGGPPGAFAVLSGGGAGLDGLSVAATVAAARAQVLRHFPTAHVPEHGTRTRVTKEARATLLPRPGVDALRPPPGRLATVPGLVVCGDWTATGLPSTLEGAAESAVRAVAALHDGG